MSNSRKDAMTDVVEHLPTMGSDGGEKPAGTVVSSDGGRITLGQGGGRNAAISSTQRGMNQQGNKK